MLLFFDAVIHNFKAARLLLFFATSTMLWAHLVKNEACSLTRSSFRVRGPILWTNLSLPCWKG